MVKFPQVHWVLISISLILYFAVVWLFGQMTLPSLLFDEYFYLRSAIWAPSDVPTANFGFTHLYGLVQFGCSPATVYFCGKSIHLAFLLAIGIAMFVLSSVFVSRIYAAWLAIASLLFSTSAWAHMFIPEIPFSAFALWALVAVLVGLSKDGSATLRSAFLGGGLLGLASLFKVHALFVIPAFVIIFLIYPGVNRKPSSGLYRGLIFIGTTLVTKLAVGFLLAGNKGLTLLGSYQSGLNSLFSSFFLQNGGDARPSVGAEPVLETLPQGGIYLGVGEPVREFQEFGVLDIAAMTLDRMLAILSILAIAFAWIVLSYMLFEPNTSDPRQVALDRAQKVLFLVVLNLVILSVVFNVYVSINGDDHSSRILFRYVEYALIPLVLISGLRIWLFEARWKNTRLVQSKWYFLFGVFIVALFGNQSQITASYADSTFVPSMGQIYVWFPILIATVTVVLVAAGVEKKARHLSVFVTVGSFSLVGILAHLDFAFPGTSGENAKATADYIVATDLPEEEVFQVVRVPQDAGKVSALLSARELNYGLAFGTNPILFEEASLNAQHILSIGGPFYDLKTSGARLIESTPAFEHFVFDGSQMTLSDSFQPSPLLPLSEFEFYSQGAFYTADGEASITIDEPLGVGRVVEICLVLPTDLQDRRVNITFDENLFQARVNSGLGLEPDCIPFEITKARELTTIKLESNVITNLTEGGKELSTVGFGLASITTK